jgi:hypothetical protein
MQENYFLLPKGFENEVSFLTMLDCTTRRSRIISFPCDAPLAALSRQAAHRNQMRTDNLHVPMTEYWSSL